MMSNNKGDTMHLSLNLCFTSNFSEETPLTFRSHPIVELADSCNRSWEHSEDSGYVSERGTVEG